MKRNWLADIVRALGHHVGLQGAEGSSREYSFRAQRWGFLYSEGDRQATIGGDMLVGALDFAVYPNQFSGWLPPHENEPLTDEKKEQILTRLWQWLEQQGIQYKVDYAHK